MIRSQDIALDQDAAPGEATSDAEAATASLPDFGALTLPFALEDYQERVRRV